MNDSILPNWRRFRIEYGFECSCPEGTIYIENGPDLYERLDKIKELLHYKHVSETRELSGLQEQG